MKSFIKLQTVDIGVRKIKIPVAHLGLGRLHKTVLITAGMDGDEYTGIKAAYQLVKKYSEKQYEGNLIIIPLVNVVGFEQNVSWNPLDDKYLKHMYQVNAKGSATEQLYAWLYKHYILSSNLWIDLHSGSSTEILNPFIEIYKTSNKIQNAYMQNMMGLFGNEIIHFDGNDKRAEMLARNNIGYILLESGEMGKVNRYDVQRHIKWVEKILLFQNHRKVKLNTHYRKIHEYYTDENGFWHFFKRKKFIRKNEEIGIWHSLDKKKSKKLSSKENGVLLWAKNTISCKKGDILFAIAFDKEN